MLTFRAFLLLGSSLNATFDKLADMNHDSDTQQLATLIDQRDIDLENLEIAETRYITSFRMLTPDPSIADFLQEEPNPNMPQISRPRPLTGTTVRRLLLNYYTTVLTSHSDESKQQSAQPGSRFVIICSRRIYAALNLLQAPAHPWGQRLFRRLPWSFECGANALR